MNKSQGYSSKNRYFKESPALVSHTIRADMNSNKIEQNLNGDIHSKKTKNEHEISNEKDGSKKETGEKINDTFNEEAPIVKKINDLEKFDVNTVPRNAFLIVVASRRSGKSHIISHFLEEYTSKNKVNGVFLFSKTGAGFEGIPSNYRYRNLDILPDIVEQQLKVKKYNLNVKKSKKIKSNIIILLDDMVGSGGMSADMRKNQMLNKLAVNGRHVSDGENSNMLIILISQLYTGISPQIRLNTDFLLTTKLSARKERENIVNSFLSLNSGRKGLSESYEILDKVVNADDYNFICIHCTKSNKKKFSDYVYYYKAPAKLKNKKLTGNAHDWKHNKKEVIF